MTRSEVWMAATIAVLVLGVFSKAATAGELALPDRTGVDAGYPPYAPDAKDIEAIAAGVRQQPFSDAERLEWTGAMRAIGRAHPGTDVGGDACISAAFQLHHTLGRSIEARIAYQEAVAAYPRGHPFLGVALLNTAWLLEAERNIDAAQEALDQFDRWRMRPPVDTGRLTQGRRKQAREIVARLRLEVRRMISEGTGELETAAQIAEQQARNRGADVHASDWRRAARLYARAGQTQDAVRVMNQALSLASDDEDDAYMRFWMLYAGAGHIGERGQMELKQDPGDGWTRKALALIDELAENPMGARYALQVGSHLVARDRHEEALPFYQRALQYPDALDKQVGPDAYLMGVTAAMRVGRFEDARRLLVRIRMMFGHIKLLDDVEIALRQAEARTAKEPPKPQERLPAVVMRDDPLVPKARIVPSGEPAPDARKSARRDEPTDAPWWLSPWVGLVLVAVALLLLVRRR